MRKIILGILFFVFGVHAFASPLIMIPPDDPVLDDLRYIVRETGRSFPSFTPPLSSDEVSLLLDELDETSLSVPAREALGRIKTLLAGHLRYAKGILGLDFRAKLNLEGSVRSDTGIAWENDNRKSESFFSLPLSFYFRDTLQIYFEPALRSDPYYFENTHSHANTNVPYAAERFDLNMPFRAFAALGGKWWNTQIGRDRISYGHGKTGNLAISDTPDYYDFLRYSFFTPEIKYSFLLAQLPMDTAELFADGFDPNHPGSPAYDINAPELRSTTNRYMYFHRLDFRLFKKLSFGVSEGVMVGNSPLELRYMNPLMLFHSFFAWKDYPGWKSGTGISGDMVGSMLFIDAEWAVMPSLALYGQFVMNELSTPYEKENFSSDLPPGGLGYLAGMEYTRAFRSWGASFYGEFVFTDPYLYTLSSPFASYISFRRLSAVTADNRLRYRWIGHPEGRDTTLFAAGAKFVFEPFLINAELSVARRGEHSLAWDWNKTPEALAAKTPSGNPETSYTAVLEFQWQVFSLLRLSLYTAGAIVSDAGHEHGEKKTGVEAGFGLAFQY